ncbi:hypothetical protein MMC30_004040 [Trapelia coarctata]|nr:hypothetical protein [Trapelia coarctata]
MARPVLHRVCHGTTTPNSFQESLLALKPALLHNYTRRKIRGRDYPAIIPTSLPTDPSTTNGDTPAPCVRGTLVTGLTDGDIYRLDIFEADEYERRKVKVKVLGGKDGSEEVEEVEADAYIWSESMDMLEDEEWNFEDFVREKMSRWIGHVEYAEVDEAMAKLEQGEDPTGGRGMGVTGKVEEEVLRSAV